LEHNVSQTDFYQTQADQARARSDSATLDNVKVCQLRAAEAWDALAARSRKSDQTRAAEAQRKAVQIVEG
jgi:hypothetical protein